MVVKKSHVRCSFPRCTEVDNTYVFRLSENSGMPPVILCEKHLNEMRDTVREFKKKTKNKKTEVENVNE